MSEEAEAGGQSADTSVAESPAQQSQETSSRPAGYDPVDPVTASPEEVQQRINYLYRQVREGQKETNHYKTMMAQKIDELVGGLGTVVNHIQDKTFSDTEASLTQQIRTAFESGDVNAMLAAQTKLTDLKVEQKIGKHLPQKQQQVQQPQYQQYEESSLSPQDEAVVSAWQDETDESGTPLRPWAKNRGTEAKPDTQYLAALAEAAAVINSPRFANLSMAEKMAEVDRRMGVKSNPRQSVMGGSLTNGRKSAKINLSPEAERIAVRMKFGGPNAKSDADHISAYLKAKENAQKGDRK